MIAMEHKIVIWADSREKASEHILEAFDDKKIEYFVSKLPWGDYMNFNNTKLVIERKNSILELANTIGKDHERFKKELRKCTHYGAHMIILIEEDGYFSLEDIKAWVNPYKKKYPRAVTGETIYKILQSYMQYYNVEVQFTTKNESADRILELLKAAG